MRFVVLLFLLVIASFAGVDAASPIECRVNTADLRLRKFAPIPLEVELRNTGNALMEGVLEVTVLHRDRRAGIHRSGPLVLSPGSRTVPVLLAPPAGVADADGITARLEFRGDKVQVPLGDHRLGSYGLSANELVLAQVRTGRRLSSLDVERARSVRLENLRPLTEARIWVASLDAPIAVENLPIQPIGWCAYDLAVFDSPAFAACTENQLTALARWLEGGGGALILTEDPLEERHLAFLRRLAGDRAGLPEPDSSGRLPLGGPIRLEPGLGRVVLSAPPPQAALDRPPWRTEVGWLWRMNAQHLRRVREDGVWPARRDDIGFGHDPTEAVEPWLRMAGMGYDSLAPDTPRPLPMGIVAALLAGLLVLAGPADWFILGWLRRRRWTWIVFPALCIAATWGAMQVAGRYLGRNGRVGAIRVVDIGPGDRVLREMRVDLRMPSKDEEWMLEVPDGVAIPLMPEYQFGFGVEDALVPPETRTEWATTSRFRLHQQLPQWTPQWRISLRFPSDQSDTGPKWLEILARWKSERAKNQPQSPDAIYHLAETGAVTEKVVAAGSPGVSPPDVRFPEYVRSALLAQPVEFSELLDNRAPQLRARALARPTQGTSGLIAWRVEDSTLHIYRRHVSAKEMEALP